MNTIMTNGKDTLIINGGLPLEGCPRSYEEANAWAQKANDENAGKLPEWSFDCGFKLDFDGDILTVSSRFYPPTSHGGATWDGYVTIYLFNKKVSTKGFDCKTLDELRIEVEKYVQEKQEALKVAVKSVFL